MGGGERPSVVGAGEFGEILGIGIGEDALSDRRNYGRPGFGLGSDLRTGASVPLRGNLFSFPRSYDCMIRFVVFMFSDAL